MNIVINPTKCTATSITASNKIAVWIAKLTKARLVDTKQAASDALGYTIERAFVVNGMFGFCDFRDEIAALCQKAKEVVWVGNDYAIKMPTHLNAIKNDSKFRRIAQYSNYDSVARHDYVDFNKLLHWNGTKRTHKYDGLFYYGAYRKDRDKSFKQWLKDDGVPVHVSTSQKNFPEFKALNKSMNLYKADGDIRRVLHLFQSSIYIEDEFTHKNLMSPANRFYEVTGAKVLLFYDASTRRTLEHAGYWDADFAVNNLGEVKEKLRSHQQLRDKQIAMFNDIDFVKQLETEFLSVL